MNHRILTEWFKVVVYQNVPFQILIFVNFVMQWLFCPFHSAVCVADFNDALMPSITSRKHSRMFTVTGGVQAACSLETLQLPTVVFLLVSFLFLFSVVFHKNKLLSNCHRVYTDVKNVYLYINYPPPPSVRDIRPLAEAAFFKFVSQLNQKNSLRYTCLTVAFSNVHQRGV